MINIVLADDHKVVRKSLKFLLGAEQDFKVIGEAGDGLEALTLVDQLKPDILILDLMMPGMNGLDVVRCLSQKSYHTGVVILSMHNNEAYVSEALSTGAMAYVLKDASADELIAAIREVAAGHYYLSSPLSSKSIEAYLDAYHGDHTDPWNTLTKREQEIFRLTIQGLTSNEIGLKLCISPRTVDTHRFNIMEKLNLHSIAELSRYAADKKLISP